MGLFGRGAVWPRGCLAAGLFLFLGGAGARAGLRCVLGKGMGMATGIEASIVLGCLSAVVVEPGHMEGSDRLGYNVMHTGAGASGGVGGCGTQRR